jgi:flagellar basal-body rod protein FlgF
MNTIYTALAGITADRQWLATVGGNLAAANSPGYLAIQSQFYSFPPVTVGRTGPNPSSNLGQTSWGVAFVPAAVNPSGGLGVSDTGRSLDLAIAGPGFLTVKTPTGTAYTKDGRLFLDASGTLVTGAGDQVLSMAGTPIHLAPGAFTVSTDGTVSQNGTVVAQLAIADLSGTLTSTPGNLYTGTAAPDTTSLVVQGALNRSGVSITQSATDMIQAETAYQGLTTLIATENTRLGEAAKLAVLA